MALGASVVRPSMVRAGQIAQSAAAAGGPTPEQAAELQMLQAKVRTTGAWIVPLLLLAAAAMAGAQYL